MVHFEAGGTVILYFKINGNNCNLNKYLEKYIFFELMPYDLSVEKNEKPDRIMSKLQ